MSYVEQINEAIASHGLWKSRLKKAIGTGESEWSVDELRKNAICAFGTWLHDLPADVQATDHWRGVHELHTRIHEQAAEVLELALAGRKAEAEAAIRFGSPFAVTSAKLTAAMTAWRNA